MNNKSFVVGSWVEVRSKEEILQTLDRDGRLEGMPFMPEMFAFCGQRFRVQKRAHKTCDTVVPIRSRRVANAVHLETRCNGMAHGGCQAGCLLFWKDAWLKPFTPATSSSPVLASAKVNSACCTENDVIRASRSTNDSEHDPRYVCQATLLPYYTSSLSPYDFRQYWEDLTSGNVRFGRWLRGLFYITYQTIINLGVGLGAPLRWLYETFQRLHGGLPYPRRLGKLPPGSKTPSIDLNLQVGEWVRVKSFNDILATCTTDYRNRGMIFDAEMMPYCGRTYRVHKRVTQILDEKTGRMMTMKNPCIILQNVVCQGAYSECRMFCPRQIYPYWREIWLERVAAPHPTNSVLPPQALATSRS
jgi:hypothetical protein